MEKPFLLLFSHLKHFATIPSVCELAVSFSSRAFRWPGHDGYSGLEEVEKKLCIRQISLIQYKGEVFELIPRTCILYRYIQIPFYP